MRPCLSRSAPRPGRLLGLLAAGLLLAGCADREGAPAAPAAADLAITGALIVDGTGAPAYTGSVLVKEGRISAVLRGDVPAPAASRSIDAAGRVLAPGFIDLHGHGDPLEHSFENFLAMGVTSVVLGQDGRNPGQAPLSDWLDAVRKQGADTHILALAGHGDVRRAAGIADDTAALSPAQTAAITGVLHEWLALGVHGMSTGLEYVPGVSSTPAELQALGAVVKAHDGILMSHMRSEDDDRIEDSIRELVSHNPDGRVHVSHLKVMYAKGAERGRRLLDFLDQLRAQGVRISADIYPYTAGYTWLGIVFPPWALPPADYAAVVRERGTELRAHLRARMLKRGGPEAILFGSEPYVGQTLAEVAADRGEGFVDTLVALGPEGGSGAHFTIDQAMQDLMVESPSTAISTDGGPGIHHPRGAGTYARLIERHVRERGGVSLEQAVHKASGLPAAIMQLHDRGTLQVGQAADLVLFDPAAVRERASYVDPARLAEGFDLVVLEGVVVREDGQLLAPRAGRLIARTPESSR